MKHKVLSSAASFLALLPLAASAATVTWTGGGDGSSWDDAANWDAAAVPGVGDTAAFSASATVNTSDASTISAYDISVAAGATVVVGAKADLPYDVTWTVGDGAELRFSAAVSGSGGIVKDGAGEVRFNASSNRSGGLDLREGVFTVTDQKQLSGTITVGDGIHEATLQVVWTRSWNFTLFTSNPTIVIRNHGVFDFETYGAGEGDRSLNANAITVEEGGILKLGRFKFNMPAKGENVICFGTVTSFPTQGGGFQINASTIVIPDTLDHAPTFEASIYPQFKYDNGSIYGVLSVPDLPNVPVDLNLPRPIKRAWDGRDGIDKRGNGTVRFSSSANNYGGSGNNQGMTRIYAGTILVDNESGSGTGYSTVNVLSGATLGGTGFIGGFAENWTGSGTAAYAANAYVTATGAAGTSAVIAPGTINDDTGAHVCGTLTVGSTDQASSVTFGNYSTLRVSLAAPNLCDCLRVYGTIDVGATETALEISVPENIAAMEPGDYVIASATEGITGAFASRSVSSDGVVVKITENEIVVNVPRPETIVLIR